MGGADGEVTPRQLRLVEVEPRDGVQVGAEERRVLEQHLGRHGRRRARGEQARVGVGQAADATVCDDGNLKQKTGLYIYIYIDVCLYMYIYMYM